MPKPTLRVLYYLPVKDCHSVPGRYGSLRGVDEVTKLTPKLDFRNPKYRREVFHRFYEFHLKYKAHPGGVYYLIPGLEKFYKWDPEQTLWFMFLNGNTQNPVTSLIIHRRFKSPSKLSFDSLRTWFAKEYARLEFDTDRRYHKKDFLPSVEHYLQRLNKFKSQTHFHGSSSENWKVFFGHLKSLNTFGRLSSWSYGEYLSLKGVGVVPSDLLLKDLDGSKSHRNGLSRVLGRDDLDWHKSNPTGFAGVYSPEVMEWLHTEAELLLDEAKRRALGKSWAEHVNYYTLESALCTFKSWHRPNRRYPNVYNDMMYLRIKKAEKAWPNEDLSVFWELRRECLPAFLRLESVTRDPGLSKVKQNWYLTRGCPVMMSWDWSCFANSLDDGIVEV